jgi:ribulose-phosphate 3-epimerase
MAITTIAPTILTSNPTEYKELIQKYYPFARRVHIDISDGTLSSNTTVSESAVWWPKGWEVDIHMMSLNPSQHIDGLIKIHPNLVIFHAEANDDLLPLFDRLKQNGIKTGVAIIKNVYPGNIKPLLNAADYALIFSGTLGQYGGEADLLLLEKVALIREIHKNIEIGWDGGANLDNTHIITHAGVDVINVGSAISRAPDPAMAFTNLNNATEKESAL